MDGPRELLVVIDEDADADLVLAQLRTVAQVTQVLAPRLALVAGPPAVPVPGATVWADDVPDAVQAALSPVERAFVAAWQSRHADKRRPSEGLPWDAAGHRPPDRPARPPR